LAELYFHNDGETFVVSHREALSHHMPANHFHSTYEVFYLMSGKREFFVKDRTLEISEGEIMIIAPNILHRTTNTVFPKHERLIVNIHEDHFMPADSRSDTGILQMLFERDFTLIKCPPQDRPAVDALAGQIIREVRGRQPGFELFAQSLTLQLLIFCCRLAKQNQAASQEHASPMHERIFEVVRYINSHYMEELSLHLLAGKFYVSPYYLSRFFKEATGFTFVEYLNNVRVKEAKKLLMRSTMKVNLIARKVGFGSVTHFGRVFKQVTGNKPLYYRRDR